jgi:hypothetical protein
MIHRSDSLSGDEGSRCATIVLERLIRGGIQTHPPVRDKTRDAGVADIADHAAGHDLPVAVGGACRDDGANGIGAAAVLSILSTRRAGWRDVGAWHDPGEKNAIKIGVARNARMTSTRLASTFGRGAFSRAAPANSARCKRFDLDRSRRNRGG